MTTTSEEPPFSDLETSARGPLPARFDLEESGNLYPGDVLRTLRCQLESARTDVGPLFQSMVTFIHLSDLHLSDPGFPGGRLLASPKRLMAWASWRSKKSGQHDQGLVAAAMSDLATFDPAAILVTGDFTQLGLPCEHEQVRDWLPQLESIAPLTLVPGNHDATAKEPWSIGLGLWRPWFGDPENSPDSQPAFPSLRVCDEVALIGLSSAHTSPPGFATGRVDAAQLDRLRLMLSETRTRGLFRVVFLHHPPVPDVVPWRKRLVGRKALEEVLNDVGVELLLHGHAHRSVRSSMELAGRTIPSLGAPSVSECGSRSHRGGRYQVIGVVAEAGNWRINVRLRAWNTEAKVFVDEERIEFEVPR